MKKYLLPLFVLFASFQLVAQKNYTQFVNPFIGTGGHGHTYPGAVVPHGMVQLSPDTRLEGWDGCSGYHYSDSFIYGFTHTHLSGTGCSDYGDILLMPMHGQPSPDNKIYGSSFSHSNETASPGFYSVQLDDDHILAELTTTTRVGLHRYSFSSAANNNIILDLKHRDIVLGSSLKIINDHTVAGLRRSRAWADNQYVFFVMEFSKPFIATGIWNDDQLLPQRITAADSSKNLKAYFTFNGKQVMVKVAISAVSIEGAQNNLKTELPGWNFEAVKQKATTAWNKELGKIDINGGNQEQTAVFYTALYHTMVVPNINMDVDGQYRGRDDKIHTAKGFTNYSVFSLWDTHRGAHPLYTIIDQKRTIDYIQSFLAQYKEGGRLPVWELSGCETDCMIGYHSVSVITDAYMKGLKNFDAALALQAMQKSSTWNHLGLPALMNNGVIEQDDEHESVSKTLEYAYDDWCIGQFAKAMGKNNVAAIYFKRAQAYKNILDLKSGFMRPRKNGNWLSPFDPREVNNNFTEANSWQYSFYIPQDISGYMQLIGGREKLEQKLDALFSEPQQTTGRDQADITGLIGQYAHGNEPSHHIAYLYNFAGKAYKTQEKVHQVLNEMYHNAPAGLEGNEDCGQMSAWYVLSTMGFYPVTPGTPDYIIGTPLFPSATIRLENGKQFVIKAGNTAGNNFYIQSAALNNQPYKKSFLSYFDITKGGMLAFKMGGQPSAFGNDYSPSSSIDAAAIVINPVIDAGAVSFTGKKEITISSPQPRTILYYTADGSVPTPRSLKYNGPFSIDQSATIKAIAVNESGVQSYVTTASFIKRNNDWTASLATAYEAMYDGGGPGGLIDGIYGSTNWRKGNWMGFQKTNVEAVIDLKKMQTVSEVTAGFLQDTRAWIVAPRQVEVEVSADGTSYTKLYSGENFLPVDDLNVQVKKIRAEFKPVMARFIKIRAVQYGKLPAWHEGAGGDTHIFIDEIGIR